MAENESLDLVRSRWLRDTLDAINEGAPTAELSQILKDAWFRQIRRSLTDMRKKGVYLSTLLTIRSDPDELRLHIRKTEGNKSARLFESATRLCGPSESECLKAWLEAELDATIDQIVIARSEKRPFCPHDHSLALMAQVRSDLSSVVKALVTQFVQNPNYLPRRTARKGLVPGDETGNLLRMSLLGARPQ
jgi:hypothetical protein